MFLQLVPQLLPQTIVLLQLFVISNFVFDSSCFLWPCRFCFVVDLEGDVLERTKTKNQEHTLFSNYNWTHFILQLHRYKIKSATNTKMEKWVLSEVRSTVLDFLRLQIGFTLSDMMAWKPWLLMGILRWYHANGLSTTRIFQTYYYCDEIIGKSSQNSVQNNGW